MNKKIVCSALLGALVSSVTLSGLAMAEAAKPPASAAQLEPAQLAKRLESVKALLEKSSAAKQIEASGDPTAKAGKEKALGLWNQAKDAYDKGDYASTHRLLLEAPKAMFVAARSAAPEQVTQDKAKADFESKRESVKALLAAQQRIADEKGKKAEIEESSKQIESLLVEAEQEASRSEYEKARLTADKAYLLAKASVGSMRSGDTLVRSLNFANKEEEYNYEIDRNETHKTLIEVLVRRQGKELPEFAKGFLTKAEDLRAQAEAAAKAGDHDAGVRLLEESTSNLAKAIRSAGVFIPG